MAGWYLCRAVIVGATALGAVSLFNSCLGPCASMGKKGYSPSDLRSRHPWRAVQGHGFSNHV